MIGPLLHHVAAGPARIHFRGNRLGDANRSGGKKANAPALCCALSSRLAASDRPRLSRSCSRTATVLLGINCNGHQSGVTWSAGVRGAAVSAAPLLGAARSTTPKHGLIVF